MEHEIQYIANVTNHYLHLEEILICYVSSVKKYSYIYDNI